MIKRFSSTYPGRVLLLAIFLTILLGAVALSLPACQKTYMAFADMFFVASSMTCVTGLSTVPLENFTLLGHLVILLLIQVGGLGIITMTLTIFSLFLNMGLTTQLLAGHIFEMENLKHIKRMFIFTLMFTAIIEFLGALLLLPIFLEQFKFNDALFYSIFHSVSSFCNAGVILFPKGMVAYQENLYMLTLTAILTFVGGIGFVCCHELLTKFDHVVFKKRVHRSSFNTKVVILMTALIIAAASIIFFVLEHKSSLINLPLKYKIANSIYNAISMRSLGTLSVNFSNIQVATALLVMVVSFIGSAPGSTGSGIKVTVFAIMIATIRSILLGRKHVEIINRSVVVLQVYKSISIVLLSIACIIMTTFFLFITENSTNFAGILFESTSALVNLGISSGITETLSPVGKIFIVINMIFGRIGSLTLALAFIKNRETKEYYYPEEKLMLS